MVTINLLLLRAWACRTGLRVNWSRLQGTISFSPEGREMDTINLLLLRAWACRTGLKIREVMSTEYSATKEVLERLQGGTEIRTEEALR